MTDPAGTESAGIPPAGTESAGIDPAGTESAGTPHAGTAPARIDAAGTPPAVAGVLLFPGASADRDSRTLVALERLLAPLPVRRLNFPNRDRGVRAPDRPPVAVAHVRAEADRFAADLGTQPDRIVLGGRSFGGRMSSMAVAEGQPAVGLLLLSYPLHPPGRPDRLRVEHLPAVSVPVLAVSGERDPFGSPDELRTHLATVAGPVTTVFVAGDHAPKGDAAIVAAVREWLGTLG